MVQIEGQIPVIDVIRKFKEDDYKIMRVNDCEAIVTKPDGVSYKVSLTGETYEVGCSCKGGEFEFDRQQKFPGRSEYLNACKHKKILMATCTCPKCEELMALYEFRTDSEIPTIADFFRCMSCEFITDANMVRAERDAAKFRKALAEIHQGEPTERFWLEKEIN